MTDPHGQPFNVRFNRARRAERDLSEFLGLAKGLLADGSISTYEADAVARWIKTHADAVEQWPLNLLSERVASIYREASKGFTADERAAMKERVRELKGSGKSDGESDVLAKIAEMREPDHAMAERLHAIVKSAAPELSSRTWYGMPAYARDGDVVCFFQSAHKFKSRYATLGFSDKASLDEGEMWPTSFALKKLTPAEESRIVALVKKAVG